VKPATISGIKKRAHSNDNMNLLATDSENKEYQRPVKKNKLRCASNLQIIW
jgi:hypothetical protein